MRYSQARSVPMNKQTFAERFCTRHQIPISHYREAVLKLSLYPSARLLWPALRLVPGHFAADREFINNVGSIKRLRDFDIEVFAYINDPNNRGFLRKVLKLRVSAARLNGLLWSTLRDGSDQPFGADEDGDDKL
jgi:hypothetical protein